MEEQTLTKTIKEQVECRINEILERGLPCDELDKMFKFDEDKK